VVCQERFELPPFWFVARFPEPLKFGSLPEKVGEDRSVTG
jgi:hypothetical protein